MFITKYSWYMDYDWIMAVTSTYCVYSVQYYTYNLALMFHVLWYAYAYKIHSL